MGNQRRTPLSGDQFASFGYIYPGPFPNGIVCLDILLIV